jgi:hypothetical protein
MFNGFLPIPLFLPPSLATWSGLSGRKIPAVTCLIAIFEGIFRLVLLSITLGNAPLFLKIRSNAGFRT